MSLKEKILLEDKSIMDKKISNPKTGRKVKVSSALSYPDNEPVHKKAEAIVKGSKGDKEEKATGEKKSLKPQARKFGVSKECVEFLTKKGFPKLSVYPQTFVKKEEIQFNPQLKKLGEDNTWVAKFPALGLNGEKIMKVAHTPGFMKKSQAKNFQKCSKIKEADILKLDKNTSKLMKNKDKRIADAAAVIKIITETGLRVGSVDEAQTGNVGVRTLRKEHFTFEGDTVKLKFIGKEYQVNVAEIKNKELVDYLKKTTKNLKPEDTVFETGYGLVSSMLKKINPKEITPKNLRTYQGTKYARELVNDPTIPPPPLKGTKPKEIKKEVQAKLKIVFTKVAALLNNTPSMAQGSYVHPAVITDYLKNMGLKAREVGYKHKLVEAAEATKKDIDSKDEVEEQKISSMDDFYAEYLKDYKLSKEEEDSISDEDAESCEEYLLPEWWDNDEWELVRE